MRNDTCRVVMTEYGSQGMMDVEAVQPALDRIP
jgi:hypothetical protein